MHKDDFDKATIAFVNESRDQGEELDPYSYALFLIAGTIHWIQNDPLSNGMMSNEEFQVFLRLRAVIEEHDPDLFNQLGMD